MKLGSGGGKGLQLKTDTSDVGQRGLTMSLAIPACVRELQTAYTCLVSEACLFFESRMREICLSGSMNGNRKQSHAKPD